MKVRIAQLLIIVYLFGATDASQLLKFPLLVSHFAKHKRENANTTLGAFLKMHYVDPQPMDADYAQDMQLPFKTVPSIPCRMIPTVVNMVAGFIFHAPVAGGEKQPLTNVNLDITSSIDTIFHPPRA